MITIHEIFYEADIVKARLKSLDYLYRYRQIAAMVGDAVLKHAESRGFYVRQIEAPYFLLTRHYCEFADFVLELSELPGSSEQVLIESFAQNLVDKLVSQKASCQYQEPQKELSFLLRCDVIDI